MYRYLVALALVALLTPNVWAESTFRASIAVSEEFNDNVREQRNGKSDFVTGLRPSVGYTYEGPRLLFETDYRGTYNHYAKATRDTEFNHDFRGHGLLDAWRSFFFIDVIDTYRLVNRDTTRGDVIEDDSTINQIQQNTFVLTPYLQPRFGERTTVRTGYRYENIWYNESGRSKNSHGGFADATYELTDQASLLTGYSFTHQIAHDSTLDRHIAYLGARYVYAENSNLFAKVGPSYTKYSRSKAKSGFYWDAGWAHDFGGLQSNVTTGVRYEDDPDTGNTYTRQYGELRLSRRFERTTVSVFGRLEDYQRASGGGSTKRTYAGINLQHELTERLTGVVSVSRDFQDGDTSDTARWFGNLSLRYALGEGFGAEIWYRVKDSYTTRSTSRNYTVNRVGLQLSKQF